MIENLNTRCAAYFYRRRKRISNAAINALFRKIRADANMPSQNLFRAVRVSLSGCIYSAICFSFERSPAFLNEEAGVVETVFGMLMIVEKGNLVAVVKTGIDLSAAFKSEYLAKIGSDRVERAIARQDAVFEKLSLRNMSVSKYALRVKTLESRDLENAVALSSASRFVPQAYRVRRHDGSFSATPGTGRIAFQSDKAGYREIVAWTGSVMDVLALGGGETSAFVRNFARSLELEAISRGVEPTFVAIDVPKLESMLFETQDAVRLVREEEGQFIELTKDETDVILDALDYNFSLKRGRSETRILNTDNRRSIGIIRIGKSRISLVKFSPPAIDGIFVERSALPLGTDGDRRSLSRFLDHEDCFTVLFSDFALAYIEGTLYRDEALRGGGAAFLRHLHPSAMLARSTSEKGEFAHGQVAFGAASVFNAVVEDVSKDSEVLLCDDLGDEWADFIGISTTTSPTMVSFYHAKHGPMSLSASAFHVSVGQAIKNLGRMALPPEVMRAKYASWAEFYRNDGVVTRIPRILRGGNGADIERHVEAARSAPDLVKKVFIVTSSLSRAQVADTFNAVQAGRPPSAHFVQLYWLLMSYFSSCVEVGAIGYVVCQP